MSGKIIRAKRQNKNIKAITLAKDLGITPAYLSLIESNQRKPDGDLLLRIQDLLELQKGDKEDKFKFFRASIFDIGTGKNSFIG